MTYFRYKLNKKMVKFLASRGYDMLLIIKNKRGGITTGELGRIFNGTDSNPRSVERSIGMLSYYLRQGRKLGLIKLVDTEYHDGFKHNYFKKNILTELGSSIVHHGNKVNKELIGITSNDQFLFTPNELKEISEW